MTWTIRLQEAFKLALSLTLCYGLTLWMNWDLPKYAALAIALIALGTAGESLQKGAMRIVGTTVGLLVALFVLSQFSQDRWLNLAFLAAYLVAVTYGLQASRFPYAWYVAGFLPALVWASTYGDAGNGFHYAVFRYLETSFGILIYTLVSTLLWPRQAGALLDQRGRDLWDGRSKLFAFHRQQLETGAVAPDAAALRSRLDSLLPQVGAALRAAFTDTPVVRKQRHLWEELSANSYALNKATALWAESIGDCRRLDTETLMPWLGSLLDTVQGRMERIRTLWRVLPATTDPGGEPEGEDDRTLLLPGVTALERARLEPLSHFDRASLLVFVRQLRRVDETTRTALRTLRVLAGSDPDPQPRQAVRPPERAAVSRWDPIRFRAALLPGIAFTAAYFFWILMDPPSGASMVSMTATLGLLAVMASLNLLPLLPSLLGVLWLVIAPIYFFVMPWLDSGVGLLSLVFVFSFAYSLAGAFSPGIKMWGLLLFVMLTGIGNDQSYSFPGLLDGAWMFVLAIAIVAGVQMLTGPVRPEQVLLASLRRFFQGCARISQEYALGRPEERARARALRKSLYGSMVVSEPGRLRGLEAKLDHRLLPEADKEQLRRLIQATQAIVNRLQALELAQAAAERGAQVETQPLGGLGRQLGNTVARTFRRWSRFERGGADEERALLADLARNLERELDVAVSPDGGEPLDDETLADLYAVLGAARGLLHAMRDVQEAAQHVDWDVLAEARF